jgi:hypothetical protein
MRERVKWLLEFRVPGSSHSVVDHIKVKSIRGDIEPEIALVRETEHQLSALKAEYGERAADLQIDVKSARVPSSYKCWISPIMSVIDASGVAYLCCNFYEQPEDLKIGELGRTGTRGFDSFWGQDRHREVMAKMNPQRVCNSTFGCDCRLVHYQQLAEPYVPYAARSPAARRVLFGGHDKVL